MNENAQVAEKARIKPLPDKYLACDHLPDPYNERDLTSFMTLWSERPDKTLCAAIDNCQTAEKIISVMQDICGEAMSTNKLDKLNWCNNYIDELRKIELRKYDEITAHIFEYMEQHCKRSAEEIAQIKADQRGRTGKGDLTLKEYVQLTEWRKDLLFGIWANVQSKNMMHEGVSFLAPNGKVLFKSWLPQKQAT